MRKRILSVLLALVCAAMALTLPVTAVTAPTGSAYKLALHLVVDHPMLHEDMPLAGVKYHLYKVGEFQSIDTSKTANGSYTYTPTTAFQDAGVELNDLDFWNDGAETLMGKAKQLATYVENNKISAVATKTTDAKGDAAFTGLRAGLYLALGDSVKKEFGAPQNTWTFYPQATLVAVPFWDPSGKWYTTVNIDVKAAQDPLPPKQEEHVSVSVTKVWAEDDHPASVTVELLANGVAVDGENATVVLSKSNNWTYTWSNVSSLYTWSVREQTISDWEATYTQKGNDFTITNRRVEPPPNDPAITPSPSPSTSPSPSPSRRPTPSRGPTVTPSPSPSNDPSATPTPTPSGSPSDVPVPSGDPVSTPSNDPSAPPTPTPSNTPTTPPPADDPDPSGPPITSGTPDDQGTSGLPQTGQLWWPVPLLVALGVFLLLIGAVLFVRKEGPNE